MKTTNKKVGHTPLDNQMELIAALDCLKRNDYRSELIDRIEHAVNSHEALLEAAKDALCELDPDCNYDGANYNGEPSDKGNSKIQTILALYKVIERSEGK